MAGNRTQKIVTTNQTNHTNNYILGIGNRLASWGDSGEALYNTAGCLTNFVSNVDGRELNLSWNERYQLTSVNVGRGTNVNYGYNVLGQLISRIELIDGVTNTEYYVHEGVNIVADLDENKDLLRSYTYAPGYDNIISMTSYSDTETNTYFYIRNHNNSVVALVDEEGDVAESYEYTVYGEVTVFDANGNELDESALGNRYTFQGREIDYTTGLYNFRARWYDSETGRWLSKDPIGINGGLNQYVFCGNNPMMFVDPEGMSINTNIPPDLAGKVEGLPYPKGGWPVWYEMQQNDYGGSMTEREIDYEVDKARECAKANDEMVYNGLVTIGSIADPTPGGAAKPFSSAPVRFFIQSAVMWISSKFTGKVIDDNLEDKYDKEPIDVKSPKTK